MGYAEYLRDMLRPVGVYDLETGAGAVELEAAGAALDELEGELRDIETEALVATALDKGLALYEELLPYRPLAGSLRQRRDSVAALLRIDEDSFTLAAMNDILSGVGVSVELTEAEGSPQTVELRFPGLYGAPDSFEELKKRIENILPCHLLAEYVFRYLYWSELEAFFASWSELEAAGLTWNELEKYRGGGGA